MFTIFKYLFQDSDVLKVSQSINRENIKLYPVGFSGQIACYI